MVHAHGQRARAGLRARDLTLILTGALLVVATYVWLVFWQPAELAGSATTQHWRTWASLPLSPPASPFWAAATASGFGRVYWTAAWTPSRRRSASE